ncbi:hypothetical protein TNCV_3069841 [Trichonephila clavipes]|nr:hypothetical protein TNCV_3069841 [Trichonephila clavipes]
MLWSFVKTSFGYRIRRIGDIWLPNFSSSLDSFSVIARTAMAGSDVVQSGHTIFDDFFQHFRPYINNNMANVVFQMVKRLWLIRIDQ